MKKYLTLCLIAIAAILVIVSAQSATLDGEAINDTCPVAKEAIDGETFAEYEGHTIGFCCAGCESKFVAWSKEKKDAFVKESLAAQKTSEDKPAAESAAAPSEPYTLSTCPVSGEKLGSMGDPIVLQVEGSEVKLCCKGCVKKFEADTARFMAVVHEGIAAQQMPYYPLETCLISGEPLKVDGKDVGVNTVVGNRLFRVCCKSCVRSVQKDAGKYLGALDAAVIEAQADEYPLKTCLVREKSKLGSMGDPVQLVVGNRLVQFCCKGCRPEFEKNTVKYLADLDAAWAAQRAMKAKK